MKEKDGMRDSSMEQLTNLEFLAAHALNGLVALAPERAEAFLEPEEIDVCQPGASGQSRACATVFGRAAARLAKATLVACSEISGRGDQEDRAQALGVLRSVWSTAESEG